MVAPDSYTPGRNKKRRPVFPAKFDPETQEVWGLLCHDKNGIPLFEAVAVAKGFKPKPGTTVACKHCGRPAAITKRLRRP